MRRCLFFIAVLLLSCRMDSGNEKGKTLVAGSPENPKENHDTLVVDKKAAVFYYPDSLRVSRRKKELGEDTFYIGADDYLYYMNQSHEYAATLKIPLLNTKNEKFLKFVKSNGPAVYVKVDTLQELWGVYLFEPGKDPYPADIVNMPGEYDKYFTAEK